MVSAVMEPWLLEQICQEQYESWLASRPRCLDCGEPIAEEWALQLKDGLLCKECQNRRQVEIQR